MWAAALQPLVRRQHEDAEGLDEGIRSALAFFIDLLPSLRPHVVNLAQDRRPLAVVWSDACYATGRGLEEGSLWRAGVGFVVAIPPSDEEEADGDASFFHGMAEVPADYMAALVVRRQQIGQLELIAALLPYFSPELRGRLRGHRIVHYIDNTSAVAALVKGYSSAPDSARIVHAFHSHSLQLCAGVWFQYVNTKANVADLPSRGDVAFLSDVLQSTEVSVHWPDISGFSQGPSFWMGARDGGPVVEGARRGVRRRASGGARRVKRARVEAGA